MMSARSGALRIAIACGGTGGHLFPGIAVAEELTRRGCELCLFVSAKEVDQLGIRQVGGLEVITLPAIGLTRGRVVDFVRGFAASYAAAKRAFHRPPVAALAMGGFTSGPPLLAARRCGAATFLHESNTVPGRANRWLSWSVAGCFVGFPSAAGALHCRKVTVTGTPVRSKFRTGDPKECRTALGLDPGRNVILVMGGSQGAGGINALVERSVGIFGDAAREWQWLHLAGPSDVDRLERAYAAAKAPARVICFLAEMETALGAATAAISRAGASSLAELAAMRVPAVLVPYPAATSNHQYFNAKAFADTGAARLLEQKTATPEALMRLMTELVEDGIAREQIRVALAKWDKPQAAEEIAEAILLAGQRVRAIRAGLQQPGSAFQGTEPDDRSSRLFRQVPSWP